MYGERRDNDFSTKYHINILQNDGNFPLEEMEEKQKKEEK